MRANDIQTIDIDVEKILPNPNQPRKRFKQDALDELAQSIKENGLITPIQVRKINDNLYELIAGERRLRACKIAGLKKISANVLEITESDSAILSIVENIQRENLNFFEEANSYKQLTQYYKMTQQQIAKALGKSQSFIANKIRLLKLSPQIIQLITDKGLSERHARALLRIPDEELQKEVIDQIIKRDLTVKKTDELVERIREDKLTNNYDEKITPDKKARVKSYINAKIYINTIKQAFDLVKNSKKDAKFEEIDRDNFIEIKIKIPK